MKISAGKSLIVEGSCRVQVLSGSLEVFLKELEPGDIVLVPAGKTYPFRALEESEVALMGQCKHTLLSGDPFPKSWYRALNEITESLRKGEKVVVLGYCDVGKSTFVLMLTNKLIDKGLKVGIVDSDVGQSKVGVPGVIAGGVAEHKMITLDDVEPKYLYFIGDNTPAGHLLQTAIGVKKVVEAVLKDADVAIIDTTGMVFGGPARALKQSKIALLEPEYLVFIEKEGELEHLYKKLLVPGARVFRVESPRKAKSTPREIRIERRQGKIREFMTDAKEIELPLDGVLIQYATLGSGLTISSPDKIFGNGVIYAELSPDSLLLVTEGGNRREVLENARRFLVTLKATYYAMKLGVPVEDRIRSSPYLSGISQEDIVRLGKLIATRDPRDIRVQVVRKDYYKGLLVGLSGKDDMLIAVGILKDVDFASRKLRVMAKFVRQGMIKKLWLGYLRYTEELTEAEKRRVDLG